MIIFDPAELAAVILMLGGVVGAILFSITKVLARTWTKIAHSTKQQIKEAK